MASKKHDDLVDVARRWLSKPWRNAGEGGHGACSVILTDMTSAAWETPDAIGWHVGRSTLVEVKVSRADFRKDKEKHFRRHPEMGAGDFRFFMTPKGLVEVSELPDKWGLIEVDEKGKTRVKKASEKFDVDKGQEVDMLLSLLCRLKVPTGRHVRIRAYNIDDNQTEPRATVTMQCVRPGLDGFIDSLTDETSRSEAASIKAATK